MTGLQEIEHRYRCAVEHAEDLRRERNDMVNDALNAGRTHADIARELGVSRGRVGQLAMDLSRKGSG